MLVFVDSVSVSGPVRQLGGIIPPLIERGYEIHCVAFQRAGREAITSPEFLRSLGASVTTLTDARALDASLISSVVDVVREYQPDLIETHNYRPAAIMALTRTMGSIRTPWVGWFHGATAESLTVRVYNVIDQLALRFADEVVVMSQRQQREKKSYRTPVSIIYNAAIPEILTTATREQVEALLDGVPRPRIGVIGRLSHEKGVDLAISAWERLVQDGHAGTLVVVGDGPDNAKLRAQVEASPVLKQRVLFSGHLDGTKHVYPLIDMLFIPSRSEGLPNTLLEAIQHPHLTIASTKVGAVPEIVAGTSAAALCDAGDVAGMAHSVRSALERANDPTREHDRRIVLSRVTLDTRVNAIVAMHARILGRS